MSDAEKMVIGTVSVVEVAGMPKAVTEGAVVSGAGGIVMVVVELLPAETFPAPSFAHAYRVLDPADAKV